MENCSESGLEAVKGIERREFIAVGVTGTMAAVAGCVGAGDDDDGTDGIDDDGDVDGTDDDDGDVDGTDDDDDPNGTEANVIFGDKELLDREINGSTVTVGRIEVENRGDAESGPITIDVQWFDSEDNYLGDTMSRLHTLKPGEVWKPEIMDSTIDYDRIDRFEYSENIDDPPQSAPDGTSISQSELDIQQFRTEIRGVVENTREDDIEYIAAIGRVFNNQDHVLGDSAITESDIPAGANWRFDIRLGSIEADTRIDTDTDPEEIDHEVILSEGVF